MKHTMKIGTVALMMVACGGEAPVESEPINVNPATLTEAKESLKSIDRLIQKQANDPRALEALAQILPQLDELNHLVARVEAAPGQFVSFYEAEPGVVGVAESGPKGAPSVLSASDMEEPLAALYERLSGGEQAPAALIQAETRANARAAQATAALEPGVISAWNPTQELAPQTGGEGISSTAEALGSGDGAFFRDHGCFDEGDARLCFPNAGGNGWVSFNTRTSFATIAPYSAPGPVSLGISYNGSLRFVGAIFQGDWLNFQWFSGNDSCGFWACVANLAVATHRYEIFNAGSSAYHWAFAAKWNCFQSSCKAWPAQ